MFQLNIDSVIYKVYLKNVHSPHGLSIRSFECLPCEGGSPVGATLREVCTRKQKGCACVVSWFLTVPFFNVAYLVKFEDNLD